MKFSINYSTIESSIRNARKTASDLDEYVADMGEIAKECGKVNGVDTKGYVLTASDLVRKKIQRASKTRDSFASLSSQLADLESFAKEKDKNVARNIDVSVSNYVGKRSLVQATGDFFYSLYVDFLDGTSSMPFVRKYIAQGIRIAGNWISNCSVMAFKCFGYEKGQQLDLTQIQRMWQKAIKEYLNFRNRIKEEKKREIQELSSYLQGENVKYIFASYSFSTHFVNDVDMFTVAGYFFSHFDDNVKSLINAIGAGGSYIGNVADEFMNDKENVKELLSGVIEEMMENKISKTYDASPIKTLSALDKLTDSSISEYLREYIDLDEVYFANKGLGKVEKYAENIKYLVMDYSENIELLESIRNIAPGNNALNDIVDELIADYTYKFESLVRDEVVDKIEEFAGKGIDSILGTNLALVNKVISGTIGKIPSMDTMDTVIHISTIKFGANQAYQAAVEKMQTGACTEADYRAYVNTFNLCKELTLKEYRAMLKYYDIPYSKERLYLTNQIRVLEEMKYNSLTPATPYGAYKAVSTNGYGGLASSGAGFGGGGGGGRFGGNGSSSRGF